MQKHFLSLLLLLKFRIFTSLKKYLKSFYFHIRLIFHDHYSFQLEIILLQFSTCFPSIVSLNVFWELSYIILRGFFFIFHQLIFNDLFFWQSTNLHLHCLPYNCSLFFHFMFILFSFFLLFPKDVSSYICPILKDGISSG